MPLMMVWIGLMPLLRAGCPLISLMRVSSDIADEGVHGAPLMLVMTTIVH